MPATMTMLTPIQELTPGMVGKIRNDVINAVVAEASKTLNLPPERLVVRDVRPKADLTLYGAGATVLTVDEWEYDATTTTANAFTTVSGAQTMGDQKFVALFGVRDLRRGVGTHSTAMGVDFESTDADAVAMIGPVPDPGYMVTLIKVSVGGADKVIWDLSGMESYTDNLIAFTQAPILIPQNVSYNIYYYFKTTLGGIKVWLQLIGVVVEPRGVTISP